MSLKKLECSVTCTLFFFEFWETKSSQFLKKVIAQQSAVEMSISKKTWRKMNCTHKTLKVIREIQETSCVLGR